MSLVKITTHIVDALSRRIEQYKSKKNIEGMIRAFVKQIQDLEEVGSELRNERLDLTQTVGVQLDKFGTIVVQEREGFDDVFYRILLQFKIGQNISKGEPAALISTIKLITLASLVHYQNLGFGQVSLSTDGTIDPALINFVFTNMQKVAMAGVRINSIICFDPDEPFSFDGTGPIGLGFSSLAAPTTGGKFAFLHRETIPFAFAGDDISAAGFGTLQDPLAGGTFVGL